MLGKNFVPKVDMQWLKMMNYDAPTERERERSEERVQRQNRSERCVYIPP